MKATHNVILADKAGEFGNYDYTSWEDCLHGIRYLKSRFPGKSMVVTNLDRCDYDSHGLTEQEQQDLEDLSNVL